jgi:hypothetical protein
VGLLQPREGPHPLPREEGPLAFIWCCRSALRLLVFRRHPERGAQRRVEGPLYFAFAFLLVILSEAP